MEFCKTRVTAFDETGEYDDLLVDTVIRLSNWWLCPDALPKPNTTGEITSRTMLRVDGTFLKFEEVQHPDYRLSLLTAIPKAVLDGETEDGYEIFHFPDIPDK